MHKKKGLFFLYFNLAPNVFTTIQYFHIALNTLENIEKIPENSNVHIKIDTGMHRNGISIDDIEVIGYFRAFETKANITGFSHTIKERMNYQQIFFLPKRTFFQSKKLR